MAALAATSTSRRCCCELDAREQRGAAGRRRASSSAARWRRTSRSGRTPARSRATLHLAAAKQGLLGVVVPRGGRRRGRRPARLGRAAGGDVRGRRVERADGRRCSPAASRCRTSRRTATPTWSTGSSGRRWPARRSARSPITEPGGGSDVAGIRTTAVRDGDHYVVNGAKTFITSGVRADFVTTAVRTGGPGHGGRQPAGGREGHARLHRRPVAGARWAGTAPTPPSCRSSTCGCRSPTWSARRTRGFVPDRRAVRGRADRAGRARLRHRRPLARPHRGVLPRARDLRQAADRQPGGAAQARRDAPAGRGRARPTRARSPRATSPART